MRPAIAALVLIALAAGAAPLLAAAPAPAAAPDEVKEIVVHARQFSFDPPVLSVQRGEKVRLVLQPMDVSHGLRLDAYGVSLAAQPGKTASAEFIADRPGKFRFQCTRTCGPLHPFMVGDLVVEPNPAFPLSLGAAGILTVLGLLAVTDSRRRDRSSWRFDLSRVAGIGALLRRRGLHQALVLLTLVFFTLALAAAFLGSPVGSHNFGIIFVWIVWWGLLKLVLIPFGARAWCAVCPLPAPGEWLQRRALVVRGPRRPWGLGRVWPRRWRGMWLQNALFLATGVFSVLILTRPGVTGAVLLAFALAALVLSLVYRGRAFCRYLCPVGGFTGVYAMAAPIELRVRDPRVCAGHVGKDCLRGCATGYACPWDCYVGKLERNTFCGMCMECVRACDRDNVGLFIRPFGKDLLVPERRLDEAYSAFIMLSSALLYSLVLLGPWGDFKARGDLGTVADLLGHGGLVLGANLVLLPGLFFAATMVAARVAGGIAPRRAFVAFAYALVPLGLLAWGAFTLGFLLPNGSYVVQVLSDPFGWGWDLFGTASVAWRSVLPGLIQPLQVALLLAGLVWGVRLAARIAQELQPVAGRARLVAATVPVAIFEFAVVAAFLRLYVA